MARIQCIISDLSQNPNAEEVTFEFDGQHHTVALTNAERHNFERTMGSIRKRLAKYTDVARSTPVKRPHTDANAPRSKTSLVREWALENGYDCPTKGRVPQWVYDSYRTAHDYR